MILSNIAEYVNDRISSDDVAIEQYITTDSLLQNKSGRGMASNLPPETCTLTRFEIGDVLVANIRPYLKKVWKADIDGGASADVLVFRAKSGTTPEFLYAVLMQDSFYDFAMLGAKGTKMPRGDKAQMMRFPITELPDMQASAIGQLISNIESKITLNRQINHNLEALAKQIYDYWFVQFDFPNDDGKPYKSSGGEMVWNEQLRREIPEGWEVKRAEDLCEIRTGKEDANFATEDGIIPFFTCADAISYCDKSAFEGNAILIAGNGNFNVKHYRGKFNAYQRTYVLIPEPKYWAVLYFAAKDKTQLFTRGANGSIVKFITKGDIADIGICSQDNEYIYSILNNLLSQIGQNNKEINSLIKQRNELLPLLMNGQAMVS